MANLDDEKFKKLFAESFIEVVTPQINRINKKIDNLEKKVEDRNDDVFTKMDQVYGEVIEMRQEQAAHRQEHDDIDKSLEDIKSVPIIAHQLRKK
jgi:hypothetical protein